MDNLPPEDTVDNDRKPSAYTSPLPQELVELIIDHVSDSPLDLGHLHARGSKRLAALRACSLVAKGWTTRAQRLIFQSVALPDTTGLRSFADALRASPHLAGYVQRLTLLRSIQGTSTSQSLYSPACVEVLFPTVLAGLLPSMRCLAFHQLPGPLSSGTQLKPVDERPTHEVSNAAPRFRPYLPIHPRFPLLLSSTSFADLEELDLSFVVFQTFNDFARTLCAFKRLRILHCGNVNWITPGILLPSFMTTTSTPRNSGKFLPFLENLTMLTMGQHGAERLLSGLALTASLRALTVHLPHMGTTLYHTGPSMDPATGRRGGPNLSPFPRLSDVTVLSITPYSSRSMHISMLSALYGMLASWNTSSPCSLTLWINPSPFSMQGQSERFYTKGNYSTFLAHVGSTVEEACTSRRGSTIPALHVLLEIPQDAKTPLNELEREDALPDGRESGTAYARRLYIRA
ncbi:hypothetical protein LXA43DRAFT_1040036 [Ganoderma leucocontextum]|nr:hypothetical protein LXA43DRAFT_1040036 [Ganoderma leucocontextum]